MSWRALTIDDVFVEISPQETAKLQALQGPDGTQASAILTNVIGEALGAVRAGGYAVADDGSVPDQLRPFIIDRTRWRWLIAFPALAPLQTPERKAANDEALKVFEKVSNQQWNIEPPTPAAPGTPTGNWNSERKIVGRSHGVPDPKTQFPGTDPSYANPDGPED